MKTIEQVLRGVVKATFCGLYTETRPKFRSVTRGKTDCPYGEIVKQTHYVMAIKVGYGSCVQKELDRLGIDEKYEPKRASHYTHVEGAVVANGDKLYVAGKVLHIVEERWFADGEQVTEADVALYLYSSQDGPIKWRAITLGNIKGVKVNGELVTAV